MTAEKQAYGTVLQLPHQLFQPIVIVIFDPTPTPIFNALV